MITGFLVPKTGRMPSRMRRASCWNSGPRWSMVGEVYGTQHAIRDIRRTGDLQEVTALADAVQAWSVG